MIDTVSTSPIAGDLARRTVDCADGQLLVPMDRPGLGVDIDIYVLTTLRVD